MTELTLATRGSKLAIAQSGLVADTIMKAHPEIVVRLLTVETTGDQDRTTEITSLTELGAFVRAVQSAVIDGRADLAVHSTKDLPIAGPDALINFHPRRGDPTDALVGTSLQDLPARGRVGTGSPRRRAQLQELRADLEIIPIRGNIDTRISLVAGASIDAVVLAVAGLERAELSHHIAYRFSSREMVPAPGQGALTIETLPGTLAAEVASNIEHADTRVTVDAERALLEITGAGCRSALGAFARVSGHRVIMDAFVADERGPRRTSVEADDPRGVAEAAKKELGL